MDWRVVYLWVYLTYMFFLNQNQQRILQGYRFTKSSINNVFWIWQKMLARKLKPKINIYISEFYWGILISSSEHVSSGQAPSPSQNLNCSICPSLLLWRPWDQNLLIYHITTYFVQVHLPSIIGPSQITKFVKLYTVAPPDLFREPRTVY